MKKKRLNKKVLLIVIGIIVLLLLILVINNKIKSDNIKSLTISLNGKKKIVLNYKEEYKDSGAKAKFKSKDLTDEIKITNDINYKRLGTYYYKYKITYKGITKEVKRTIKIVDKEKPEIKLNGDEVIDLIIGSNYEEKSVVVTDNYDKNLKVTTDGSVDTKKVGEYIITYKVVDSSNNENSITRKVIVNKKQEQEVVKKNDINTNRPNKTSKGYNVEQKNGLYYINGILVVNKTYPLSSSYNPGDLTGTFKTAFNRMQSDAASEGISLRIISGFRSYTTQNRLYNNYVARDGKAAADRYSARPGHSEHQSGLAADINSLDQSWENTKEGRWLNNNCYKYGFIIRYVKGKESSTGYMFEPWHIRYVGENVAKTLYNNGNWITLEEYLGISSKY